MSTASTEQMDGDPAVRLHNVSCRIGGRTVIDTVTLEVARGEIVGILGPNGAGKSTLLGLITGLRRSSSGEVVVLGRRLPAGGRKLRRRIGVVLQETALYEDLTAAENLYFSAALYDVPDARRRTREVLDLLGLLERTDDVVGTLSGGLRRRIAIARALLHRPELLIVDEPTLGVDAEARHAIWSHLRLLRSLHTTIVVATNYLDEAQALCDSAGVLRAGRLIAYDTPDALVARAGRCIDVECEAEAGEALGAALRRSERVLRIERAPSGITVFLDGQAVPDQVVRLMLATAPISGFHIRAADLAEVFQALEAAS